MEILSLGQPSGVVLKLCAQEAGTHVANQGLNPGPIGLTSLLSVHVCMHPAFWLGGELEKKWVLVWPDPAKGFSLFLSLAFSLPVHIHTSSGIKIKILNLRKDLLAKKIRLVSLNNKIVKTHLKQNFFSFLIYCFRKCSDRK